MIILSVVQSPEEVIVPEAIPPERGAGSSTSTWPPPSPLLPLCPAAPYLDVSVAVWAVTVAHAHQWRHERSSYNEPRGRKRWKHTHTHTHTHTHRSVHRAAWGLITAAAATEERSSARGATLHLFIIYLLCGIFITVTSKMNGVTRSLCTFEDIRNQEQEVSYSMLFSHYGRISYFCPLQDKCVYVLFKCILGNWG